jgi:hypothetical protein
MCHNQINDSEVMTLKSWRWLLEILIDPKEVTYRLQNLSLIEVRSAENQNSEVVGNSISFLKRVETQNFKTGPNLFGNEQSSLN